MTTLDWHRIEELYAAALDHPSEQRMAFLHQACQNEPEELKKQVELLLTNSKQQETEVVNHIIKAVDRARELLVLGPGECLQSRYRIQSVLGIGGMGIVYEALDQKFRTPQPVAIKMISAEIAFAEEAWERFQKEANHMAQLREHERFVRLYDIDSWNGHPFMVMELVKGGSLPTDTSHPPVEAATLVATVARAISQVHALGIVHRDLKPGNILLTEKGEPKIADFGIARLLTDHTDQGRIMGSPAHMSPEQLQGDSDRIGPATDIYALGVILYQLLTGSLPYSVPLEDNLLEQRARNPGAQSLAAMNRSIPGTLQTICTTCLKHDPQDRYQSAAILANRLERWSTLRPQPEDNRFTRAQLWCARNPVAMAFLVLLLLFLTLIGWRVTEMLREPFHAQLALARSQARIVSTRLRVLRQPVEAAAKEAEDQWHQIKDNLQPWLMKIGEEKKELNGRSPFASWFLVNSQGRIIARWPRMNPQLDNKDLRARDYNQGALTATKGAHVSKVYQSILKGDKKFKIGIASPIYHKKDFKGALVATVTTGANNLGIPFTREESTTVALLVPRDPFDLPDEEKQPPTASPYLILRHPAYSERSKPVWFPKKQEHLLKEEVSSNYQDPVEQSQQRYLAAFAPVQGTDWIVIVQRPHQGLFTGSLWLIIGAVALIGLTLTTVILLRHRYRTGRGTSDPES